jgi:hypothetical protein
LTAIDAFSERATREAVATLGNAIGRIDPMLQDLQRVKKTITQLELALKESQDSLDQALNSFQFQDINHQKMQHAMSMILRFREHLSEAVGTAKVEGDAGNMSALASQGQQASSHGTEPLVRVLDVEQACSK